MSDRLSAAPHLGYEMTAPFRTHGLDVVHLEHHPESLYAFDGTILVGRASPWVAGEPDGPWYARRTGKKAVKYGSRHQALAHIVGGCPDCRCDDGTCAVCVGGWCRMVPDGRDHRPLD